MESVIVLLRMLIPGFFILAGSLTPVASQCLYRSEIWWISGDPSVGLIASSAILTIAGILTGILLAVHEFAS